MTRVIPDRPQGDGRHPRGRGRQTDMREESICWPGEHLRPEQGGLRSVQAGPALPVGATGALSLTRRLSGAEPPSRELHWLPFDEIRGDLARYGNSLQVLHPQPLPPWIYL